MRRHENPRAERAGERGVGDVDGDDFGAHDELAARIAIELGAMLAQQLLGAQRARAGELAQRAADTRA